MTGFTREAMNAHSSRTQFVLNGMQKHITVQWLHRVVIDCGNFTTVILFYMIDETDSD